MANLLAEFDFCQFYHIFNRTNNGELLFRSDENRRYFLKLMANKLHRYVQFYAYGLLDNLFHFAVSIRSEEEIISNIQKFPLKERTTTEQLFLESKSDNRNVHKFIAQQWSRVFNSYSQAYNKKYGRTGNLFHRPMKRSLIRKETKFTFLIYYIHHNSRKHGLVKSFENDNWHSNHEILSKEHTFLEKNYIMEWFGGKESFIEFHNSKQLEKDFLEFWIE